jgi:hypothetical protein
MLTTFVFDPPPVTCPDFEQMVIHLVHSLNTVECYHYSPFDLLLNAPERHDAVVK